MKKIKQTILKNLYQPAKDSHKGQNGKLLIIGGSELFHAASRWSLKIASRVVDMVFYSSIPFNNQLIKEAKKEFVNGIIVPRDKVEDYIQESDCVLIGPGMTRSQETRRLTNVLLSQYPRKRWVIDAGALQMLNIKLITKSMILVPHSKEFERLFGQQKPAKVVQQHPCTLVLKGPKDLVCNAQECFYNLTGNEGMTKGGTGDVLVGLMAAFYCKNPALLAAKAAVYINGLAGDSLYKRVGPYFNASDLVDEIPRIMAGLIYN